MATEHETNPTSDEAGQEEAELNGHDRYEAEDCLSGGWYLRCDNCPFE